MAAVAKHYVREWEEYPDLFVFSPTCSYDAMAALRVARMICDRFGFPLPIVLKRRRRQTCLCEADLVNEEAVGEVKIILCAGFSVGQFLHEMAHAWCFNVVGNHDHGETFRYYAHRLYFWFRLDEQAQAAFFP